MDTKTIKKQYQEGLNHNPTLIELANKIRTIVTVNDDDCILLLVGETGAGKSNLMLWLYELFDLENCSTDYITLDAQQFADAVAKITTKKGLRFLCNDEANVNSRNAMTNFNKDIIDFYMANRGMNIFHIWCNPSANMIDKAFLEERIRGILYVYGKQYANVRRYTYFAKKHFLKILKEEGDLKQETLHKYRKFNSRLRAQRYHHNGWFKKYTGDMSKPYLEKKGDRMSVKALEFSEKWGSKRESFSATEAGKKLDCSRDTVKRLHKKMLADDLLVEGTHFKISPTTGRVTWFEEGIDSIESYALEN